MMQAMDVKKAVFVDPAAVSKYIGTPWHTLATKMAAVALEARQAKRK